MEGKENKNNWNAFTRAVVGKEGLDKIGTYKESYGGGTPLLRGEKAPSKEWVKENRSLQPRDELGRFTYNSANAKPLSTKTSRGTTTPPFLIGKQLYAIKNRDVLKAYSEEDMKKHEYVISTIDRSEAQLVESCKVYVDEYHGFSGMSENAQVKKKGRHSDKEKRSGEGKVEGGRFAIKKASKSTQNEFSMKRKRMVFARKGRNK